MSPLKSPPCPKPDCGSGNTTLVETRVVPACGSRVRRRRCECCGHRWNTVQAPEEIIEAWRFIWAKRGIVAIKPLPESSKKGKV